MKWKWLIWIGIGLFALSAGYLIGARSPVIRSGQSDQIAQPAPPKEPVKFSIIFGGDVIVGRHVQEKVFAAGDYNLPFREVGGVMRKADLTFVNFESPFRTGVARTSEGMVFGTRPELASMLEFAGIDVVSLANNHIGDQGSAGIEETIKILDEKGIKHTGAGLNLDQARQPAITEVKGVKIGWLAYQNIADYYYADNETAGTTSMNLDYLKEDIKKLRPQVDYLIVCMHSGTEYIAEPRSDQVAFAHAAIDDGADFVIGNHPHWVQRYENYNGKPIFYAAGNLIFDQQWSQETREGVLLRANFTDRQLDSVEVLPHLIYDYNQPRAVAADSPTAKRVLDKLGIDSFTINFNGS